MSPSYCDIFRCLGRIRKTTIYETRKSLYFIIQLILKTKQHETTVTSVGPHRAVVLHQSSSASWGNMAMLETFQVEAIQEKVWLLFTRIWMLFRDPQCTEDSPNKNYLVQISTVLQVSHHSAEIHTIIWLPLAQRHECAVLARMTPSCLLL